MSVFCIMTDSKPVMSSSLSLIFRIKAICKIRRLVTAPDKVAAENHMVFLFSRCVSCEGSRLFISHNFAVSGFQSYLCLNTLYGLTYGYELSIPLCHFPEFIILEYINNLKPLVCVSD